MHYVSIFYYLIRFIRRSNIKIDTIRVIYEYASNFINKIQLILIYSYEYISTYLINIGNTIFTIFLLSTKDLY